MNNYTKNKVLNILNNIRINFFNTLFYFILLCCFSTIIYSQKTQKQLQIVKVGIYHNPPLEDYINGKAVGLYPTLLDAIAIENNWKIEYVFSSWNEVYEDLLTDKIDLLSNIIYLPERDSLVDFNKETVLAMWIQLYTGKKDNFNNLYHLNSKKIGVLKGGANGIEFKKMMVDFNITPDYINFKDYESIAKAIEEKQIKVGIINNFVGNELSDNYQIKKSTIFLQPNRLLFATKKGKNNSLLNVIDSKLKLWKNTPNSIYYEAIDQWITKTKKSKFNYTLLKWFILIIFGAALLVLTWVRTLRNSRKKAILNYKKSIQKLSIKEAEKQKIETKLQSTENYLQTIFDGTTDAIFIYDGVTGEILDVNQQMCSMFGYTKAEAIRQDMQTLSSGIYPYTKEEVANWIARAKEKGPQLFEWQGRHKDGHILWQEVSLKYIFLNGEDKCLATFRNIEERKEAENKQNKANRLFDTLSQISLAVATLSEKKNLLHKICDIITKIEHYKLAWIGFVDTKNKLIKPLVFSGENAENVLADFEISLTDEKLAKGPTRRALSEKKSIVINNVLTDVSFNIWRKKAKELGYRSFISLPIFHHNKVIGTLNIDTDQYSFFDTSEVTLLERVTLNISIALEKFEQEENRLKVEKKLKESYQIINRSPAVAFLWKKGKGWQVQYVSENVQKLTEYSVDDFLIQKISYFNIIHKDDIARVIKEVVAHSEDKKSTSFSHKPYRILTKSGKIKWVSDYSVIRRNEKNEITHFEGLLLDITNKKLTEEKIQKSNEFIFNMLENMTDGYVSLNTNWEYTNVNQKAAKMFGRKTKDLIGKNIWTEFPEGVNQPFYKNYYKAVETQNEIIFEDYYLPWGKWFENRIIPSKDGLAIFFQDITEKKLAENTIKERGQQMISIYNTVNDIIFYLKVEAKGKYRFLSVNKAFTDSIGVEKQHIEGKFVNEIIPEPSLSLVLKKYKEAIVKKEVISWEETTTYPTGTKVGQVTVAPIFNDKGICTYLVGSVHDITEIKIQSQGLKQLNNELKLLHKVSQNLSGKLNLKDLAKQALANLQETIKPDIALFYMLQDGVLKLISYRFETVEFDLTHEKEHSIGSCLCGLAASTKKSIFSEDIFKDFRCTIDSCKNAGLKSFAGIPLIAENKVLGVIGLGFAKQQDFKVNKNFIETFIFDMALGVQNVLLLESLRTHEAELEAKIKESTNELAHSNRELRDFAQIVSHDLKAPLRAISQLSYWLSQDYADKIDKEGQNQLNLLIGRVQRLDNLIEGILQFSRIGKVKEKDVKINLTKLVEDTIELLDPPENIHIKVDTELPIITADPTRIGQLFQNLIQNAIKFMDKPTGFINIGVNEKDHFYEFYVKDNGCGIDEQYFDRIFKIFQRLVSRDEQEGTGIGLSLVKRIAQIYGGDVWLASKVNEGTTFYITFPKK